MMLPARHHHRPATATAQRRQALPLPLLPPRGPGRPSAGPTAASAAGPRRRRALVLLRATDDGPDGSSSDPNNKNKGSPTPSPPPPPQGSGGYAALLASLLAYSGLVGTVAVAVGYAAGVDPFGNAHWSPPDILLALLLLLPVTAANVAVLWPEHSDWDLPDADKVVAERARAAELAEEAEAESRRRERERRLGGGEGPAAAAEEQQPKDEEAAGLAAAAAAAAAKAAASTPESQPQPNPQPPKEEERQRPRRRLRDALNLAQGAYLQSYSPAAAQLPFPVEVAAVFVDCAASEMLWRAVLLRGAGGWLADRLYEGGLEDTLAPLAELAARAGGGAAAAQAAAAAASAGGMFGEGAGAGLAPLGAWMVLAAATAAAAGALARRLASLARQRAFMAALTTAAAKAAQQKKRQDEMLAAKKEKEDAERAAGDKAAAAAGGAAAADEGTTTTPTPSTASAAPPPPPLAPPALLPPSVADAVALSQLFQGARDVYQLAVLGVSFLLTGNLAAPVVASAVNGAFLSAMARRALERNKARSATLAKELEQLNDRLAEMAKQQRQRRAERLRREREEEDAAREKAAAAGRAAAGAAVGGRLGETLSALDSMLAATEEKKA